MYLTLLKAIQSKFAESTELASVSGANLSLYYGKAPQATSGDYITWQILTDDPEYYFGVDSCDNFNIQFSVWTNDANSAGIVECMNYSKLLHDLFDNCTLTLDTGACIIFQRQLFQPLEDPDGGYQGLTRYYVQIENNPSVPVVAASTLDVTDFPFSGYMRTSRPIELGVRTPEYLADGTIYSGAGSGVVRRVFMAILGSVQTRETIWSRHNLQVYYGDEVTPTIDTPLRDIYAQRFGISEEYENTQLQLTTNQMYIDRDANIGLYFDLPMPYDNGIRIKFSGFALDTLYSNVVYEDALPECWNKDYRLHMQTVNQSVARNSSVNLFTTSGNSGYIVGSVGQFQPAAWGNDYLDGSVNYSDGTKYSTMHDALTEIYHGASGFAGYNTNQIEFTSGFSGYWTNNSSTTEGAVTVAWTTLYYEAE